MKSDDKIKAYDAITHLVRIPLQSIKVIFDKEQLKVAVWGDLMTRLLIEPKIKVWNLLFRQCQFKLNV